MDVAFPTEPVCHCYPKRDRGKGRGGEVGRDKEKQPNKLNKEKKEKEEKRCYQIAGASSPPVNFRVFNHRRRVNEHSYRVLHSVSRLISKHWKGERKRRSEEVGRKRKRGGSNP